MQVQKQATKAMSDAEPIPLDGTLRAVVAADRIALAESVDDRELLQRRLSVFYGYFAVLNAFLWLVAQLAPERVGLDASASGFIRRMATLQFVVLLGVFAALRARAHAPRLLRVLDVLATLATSVGSAVAFAESPRVLSVDVSAIGFFILFFVLHAALVPSKPRSATLVTATCAVPFAVGLAVMYQRVGRGIEPNVSLATFAVCIWLAAGVAAVYVLSSTIYGLRTVAERAVQLGQYVVHEKIGEGGMGAVYRASHEMLKRPTAIKLIAPDRAGERAIARFEREVMAASRLSHPNNVAIFDFGRTRGGVFYYAMELLEGEDLSRLVEREGPQTERRALHILRQIATALAEAHGVGLVHRDIKPENVMLCTRGGVPDFVKVLDFGLVKNLSTPEDFKLTHERALAGTPLYMAPESVTSPETVGPKTDIYALGCVAFFLLVGRPPFQGSSIVEICLAHAHEAPDAPSTHASAAISPAVDALVLRCLAKDPEARPTTSELAASLAELTRE